ncbi:cellulose 1,4-beta-cellobiosidase [Micromonospora sp. M42]|nr:cellulose 1,4-beta-cellobiosidase [Micromonospora sp. M42]
MSEQLGETARHVAHGRQPRTRAPATRSTCSPGTPPGGSPGRPPPLTFATGSPAESSCAVRFNDDNDWGNGYVANVEVINTGAKAIDGWTLTWTWPTDWQQVSSGWSATWDQQGRNVRVTPTADNRRLAADGGSTTVGFVGAYSGPNVPPGAFRLNGTVCTLR